MGHALLVTVMAGMAGALGFGVARTLHASQLPQPEPARFAESVPAASQLAAVLGGPAFRAVPVPATPPATLTLPALPQTGSFRFDTITLNGDSSQRHRVEGAYANLTISPAALTYTVSLAWGVIETEGTVSVFDSQVIPLGNFPIVETVFTLGGTDPY